MRKAYSLILAGGSGTRFWPLSRNHLPKQLLRLFGNKTLLEQTLDRITPVIDPSQTFILTNPLQKRPIEELLSKSYQGHIITEPCKRDTAPAIALGIGLIAREDPEAVMCVLPSDHLIQNAQAFNQDLQQAIHVASEIDALVTIGIKPTWACSSYGYIERGKEVTFSSFENEQPVYEVKRFREKPNREMAEQFLAKERFSWNSGMFIWSIPTVRETFAQLAPEFSNFIERIIKAEDPQPVIDEQFPKLHATSIDYELMEQAPKVLNLQSSFDWDDVGSWPSVGNYLQSDTLNNLSNTSFTSLEAESNIVFNHDPNCHIALLGVSNLIVVQTPDALLVANRHQTDEIKNLVSKLPKELL